MVMIRLLIVTQSANIPFESLMFVYLFRLKKKG